MVDVLPYLRELNIWSMMLRVLLAILAGGLIGLERERKHRPAGFRTYTLVALGASLTIMLSQYLMLMLKGPWLPVSSEIGITTDVSRFGAQVINGVGFLGAGTILVTNRQEVKGLTTAAGLWASACMGLAVGAGFYEGVLVCFLLIFFIMRLLPRVEKRVLGSSRNMNLYVELDSADRLSGVLTEIKQKGIRVYDMEVNRDAPAGFKEIKVFFSTRLPARQDHTEILAMLSRVPGLTMIEEV